MPEPFSSCFRIFHLASDEPSELEWGRMDQLWLDLGLQIYNGYNSVLSPARKIGGKTSGNTLGFMTSVEA